MRIRTKAVTAIVVGLSLLAGSAAPASANSVTVLSQTVGVVALYGPFSGTPAVDVGFNGNCARNRTLTATATTGTTGTVTLISIRQKSLHNPFGDSVDYFLTEVLYLSGTYSGSGAAVSLTGESAITLRALTGTCTSGTQRCTLVASNLVVSGTLNTGSFPTLATGNSLSLTGSNEDFETAVVGASCGGFAAVDNGSVNLQAVLVVA